jgi:hypothetical protein
MQIFLVDEVQTRLRKATVVSGSQTRWAEEHGVSKQYVSFVLTGQRKPSAKILNALGLEKVVGYRRKKNGR